MTAGRGADCRTKSRAPVSRTWTWTWTRTWTCLFIGRHAAVPRSRRHHRRRRSERRRCFKRLIIGGGSGRGFARPATEIGRPRPRRPARGRHDLKAAITRPPSVRRIIAGHAVRRGQQKRQVSHGWRHHPWPVEAELALNHAPRRVYAIDVHGHAWAAGNDKHRLALSESRGSRHSQQHRQTEQTHQTPAIEVSRVLYGNRRPNWFITA
jgi:hypothetical protein